MTTFSTAPPTVPLPPDNDEEITGADEHAAPRGCELRIGAAPEIGFVIWEHGEIAAALTSRQEVAAWIVNRLARLPGEPPAETPFMGPRITQPPPMSGIPGMRVVPGTGGRWFSRS